MAATGYVLNKSEGADTVFFLLKTLYVADRTFLLRRGRTITGDKFVSMDKGPVLSILYDLMKGKADPENQTQWSHFFSAREGNDVRLKSLPDLDYLSEAEIEVLDEAIKQIAELRKSGKSISDWCHENFPEWEAPHGSSIPIDPAQILRLQKVPESEISELENEVGAVTLVKSLLS